MQEKCLIEIEKAASLSVVVRSYDDFRKSFLVGSDAESARAQIRPPARYNRQIASDASTCRVLPRHSIAAIQLVDRVTTGIRKLYPPLSSPWYPVQIASQNWTRESTSKCLTRL
jgi:hypothetical protein